MKIEQRRWTQALGWEPALAGGDAKASQLVLAFGAPEVLRQPQLIVSIRDDYPAACVFGCSTAGEICGEEVLDDSLVVTALQFERSQLHVAYGELADSAESFDAGARLGASLPRSLVNQATGLQEPLVHVLVLTDGLSVNGSEFASGLMQQLPKGVDATGGLAGDGARFGQTLVLRDGVPKVATVAALGLYGSSLKVGFGSVGGWDPFGPERLVTKSKANVLYELDGRSALGLYKQYLGEHAEALPATGLLFPLSIRMGDRKTSVVRTILAVDETAQSLTFAGDVPEGAYARLMKANFDRLIDGASAAAQACVEQQGPGTAELALLVSCVGRKLVLKQLAEDEVEAVRHVLGNQAVLAGFYSYGEIAPFAPGTGCELHNQTMTVTTLSEQ